MLGNNVQEVETSETTDRLGGGDAESPPPSEILFQIGINLDATLTMRCELYDTD
jgi:hypothetical protein